MALVDYGALVVDLRGRLRERPSWGSAQVRELIDELEQQHRIDEAEEARVLRHYGDHVVDIFLGHLPAPATSDPLTADAPSGTPAAMDDGAGSDPSQTETIPCRTTPPPPPPSSSRPTAASRPASPVPPRPSRTPRRAAAAR